MENNCTLRRNGRWLPTSLTENRECRRAMSGKVQSPSVVAALIGFVIAACWLLASAAAVRASTYVVYVALDDPLYQELDTLNGLGLLDDYLSEIKPIARVEAARLILEAERNLTESEQSNPLASSIISSLSDEFSEEIQWLDDNHEDNPPTMIHPLERVEAQYIYSGGTRRLFPLSTNPREFQGQEGTPLLPNNDGLPTLSGSNEILRVSSWGGVGGFLSAYGETAIAGPITRSPVLFQQSFPYAGLYPNSPAVSSQSDTNRLRLMRGGVVASIGNQALSFGYQEMAAGTGYFGALSQGNNSRSFPALTFQNVHAYPLPGFLRYLGPFRHQIFFGEMNHGRYSESFYSKPPVIGNYSYPWISGQVIAFKPLPMFEFGLDHAIMFGGTNNSNYSWRGFIGRATGLSTGGTGSGSTNSRAGAFLKIYLPALRNTQIYQEMLAEDNAGGLPIKAVSFQGGVYIPRVTADGLTDARFEYAVLESNYSEHADSLYWAYYGQLMGDQMGPDASQADLSVGRWFNHRYKSVVELFYTERAPHFGTSYISKERSGGFALDVLRIPDNFELHSLSLLGSLKVRAAVEYVHDINWAPGTNSVRTMVLISGSIWPSRQSWIWH